MTGRPHCRKPIIPISIPDILLGDEPTGNLDEENEGIVIDILRTLHNEGATIIVVTHNPEVEDVAQRKTCVPD